MLWLWLACASTPPPSPDALARAAEPGWSRRGCTRARSEGVATVTCTLHGLPPHEGAVAVLTSTTYDRVADAARAWDGGGAVGWREGGWVLQVDVWRPDRAQALLEALPPGGGSLPPPWSGECHEGVCFGAFEGDAALVVSRSDRDLPLPDGHVAHEGRMAAVTDRAAATVLRDQLIRRLAGAEAP